MTVRTPAAPSSRGLVPVNGVELHHEVHGDGPGTPLVLLPGGFGSTELFHDLVPRLGARRVVLVDPSSHGRSPDHDRPFTWSTLAADLLALVEHLQLGPVDLFGYSLGGGTVLRAALDRPDLVRRLVVASAPCRSAGWYDEVRAGMRAVGREAAAGMVGSPMHQAYTAVAPDPEAFAELADKTGQLLAQDYDWSDEVAGLELPVLLVQADTDGFPLTETAHFFARLGGGLRDAGWDGSGRTSPAQLAVLPGRTHYDLLSAPTLPEVLTDFLDG